MPGSYYDRLGDLLSEVLEAGEIPKTTALPESGTAQDKDAQKEAEHALETTSVRISASSLSAAEIEPPAPPRRALTDADRQAFKTLSIPETADYAVARSIYRKKLLRFHPDRQGDNAVLQKVAREKTAAFIEAWAALESYFAR